MLTRVSSDGKEKVFGSLRQLERNLWRVERVEVFEGKDTWVGVFVCADSTCYVTNFETREAAWDWCHRRALREATLVIDGCPSYYILHEGARGSYPWKMT